MYTLKRTFVQSLALMGSGLPEVPKGAKQEGADTLSEKITLTDMYRWICFALLQG